MYEFYIWKNREFKVAKDQLKTSRNFLVKIYEICLKHKDPFYWLPLFFGISKQESKLNIFSVALVSIHDRTTRLQYKLSQPFTTYPANASE